MDHRLTETMNNGMKGFYQEGYSISYFYRGLIEKIINSNNMKIIIGNYNIKINLSNFDLKRIDLE